MPEIMETKRDVQAQRAFTLIELLIVVAIIAILAAIAVPNFLEAQVRSKVSRVYADIRAQGTGLECYYIDHGKYPLSFNEPRWPRLTEITTPIAYISTCPFDPFGPKGAPPLYYHYVSATDELGAMIHNWGAYNSWDTKIPYPGWKWHIRGYGPNRQLDHGFPYDATNGTVSPGDICVWGPGFFSDN